LRDVQGGILDVGGHDVNRRMRSEVCYQGCGASQGGRCSRGSAEAPSLKRLEFRPKLCGTCVFFHLFTTLPYNHVVSTHIRGLLAQQSAPTDLRFLSQTLLFIYLSIKFLRLEDGTTDLSLSDLSAHLRVPFFSATRLSAHVLDG
jgi:hypothetical protein